MFREMRRKRQLLPTEECVAILERMTNGTLALYGDDGYPYAAPRFSLFCIKKTMTSKDYLEKVTIGNLTELSGKIILEEYNPH